MSGRRLAATLTTQIGTGAGSLIGILSWDRASAGLKTGLAAVVLGFVVVAVVLEISAFLTDRGRGYRTPSRINRFMHRWISERGKVAIFSNDMSWVSDDVHVRWYERVVRWLRRRRSASISELLLEKARKDELTLCLPRETALSQRLEQEGARVTTYAALKIVPEGRFTIIRYGQQDAEVAIGRSVRGVHRIETFAKGEHPAFALAEDLVRFADAFTRLS
jgi:hypothetical protein